MSWIKHERWEKIRETTFHHIMCVCTCMCVNKYPSSTSHTHTEVSQKSCDFYNEPHLQRSKQRVTWSLKLALVSFPDQGRGLGTRLHSHQSSTMYLGYRFYLWRHVLARGPRVSLLMTCSCNGGGDVLFPSVCRYRERSTGATGSFTRNGWDRVSVWCEHYSASLLYWLSLLHLSFSFSQTLLSSCPQVSADGSIPLSAGPVACMVLPEPGGPITRTFST